MAKFDFRKLLSSLEEVGQCPICLELVKPPVTLCVNGHGVCTACRTTLLKCPTCSMLFCSVQPRVLNEILQKIPKACKYGDAGCSLPATDDHEIYCEFRTVKCNFLQESNDYLNFCDCTMPANSWLDHMYVDPSHLNSNWLDIDDHKTFKIRKFKDVVSTKSVYDHTLEVGENSNIFVFYYAKIKGNFCLYIKHFPLAKPTDITYFTISFGKSYYEVMYKYKIKATTMITLEREVKVDENVYCLRVPLEELDKLVDVEGDLHAYFEVTAESL